MNYLIMASQMLLGLSILIVLHEMGHFLAARAFGIKVEKFYLFFDAWGFKLFSFKRGDTEYGMGWLPLGGYVKIAGMIDESMDKEAMKQPAQSWEFRSKPAWQRLIVMLGGVTVNFILGIFIFWMLFYVNGEKHLPLKSMKYGIVAEKLGKELGFKTGDMITGVVGQDIKYYDELFKADILFGSNIIININRNGKDSAIILPNNFIDKLSESTKGGFIQPRVKFSVGDVVDGDYAKKAGVEKGDIIVKVSTDTIIYQDQFIAALGNYKDKTIELQVWRAGKAVSFPCKISEEGKIGILMKENFDEFQQDHKEYSLGESFSASITKGISTITDNLKGFGKIFSGEVSASNSVQGPIGIMKFYGEYWDWTKFWSLTAMISMVLAFMNLLPIPALDGGHVVFLLIEIIIRRPLSEKILERAQVVGMIILLTLMVLIFGNDIWKTFIK
ncbi:MAG: RIP metalloprotease RseP [Bacteroidota bacterium]|nr:RIP metalloprotease RseP [Bacteroidota bacterium]